MGPKRIFTVAREKITQKNSATELTYDTSAAATLSYLQL